MLSDADIRALTEAMRRAGVDRLEVEGPGQRLRLTLEPSEPASVLPAVPVAAEPSTTLVKAESMGYFRARHPDGLFPPCEAGATVDHAQILGFVQVGLLLLPVLAPHRGRLARILSAADSLVGYGTPLFEVRHDPSDGAQH